jgi:hypothetical protein
LDHHPKRWGFTPPTNAFGNWKRTVFPPHVEPHCKDELRPFAVRLQKKSDDSDHPREPIIDVYEAYWSPIDKNQTKATSVVNWILHNLFVPANTDARLYASTLKSVYDFGYFMSALILIAVLMYAIIAFGISDYQYYVKVIAQTQHLQTVASSGGALDTRSASGTMATPAPQPQPTPRTQFIPLLREHLVALQPRNIFNTVPTRVVASVAMSIIAAYLLVQGFASLFGLIAPSSNAWGDFWQVIRRLLWSVVPLGLGVIGLIFASQYPLLAGQLQPVGWSVAWLAGAVLAFRLILHIAQNFLVNIFGDVQIYCSHNENSRFFDLRQSILKTVEGALACILRSKDPSYKRVIVVAHSLGSTIAMDALIRLHNLVREEGLTRDEWRRIRAFVTFGSSLEKTKFFFDAQKTSFSEKYGGWHNKLYGHMFSKDFGLLKQDSRSTNSHGLPIFWCNYWYSSDIVANEIVSYRSQKNPGKQVWCFDGALANDKQSVSQDVSVASSSTARTPNEAKGLLQRLRDMRGPSKPPGDGSRAICENVHLRGRFPMHVWVHSDYLTDNSFWRSVHDGDKQDYPGVLEILLTGSPHSATTVHAKSNDPGSLCPCHLNEVR